MNQTGDSSKPLVSVVVRSYNRIDSLMELLGVLVKQDYPKYEVVVIEQSTNATPKQLKALQNLVQQYPIVRIHKFPPLGPARARNMGWRLAKGEIVLYADDDDLPLTTDWISAHAKNYIDPNCIAVTGRHVQSSNENPENFNTLWNRLTCLRRTLLMYQRARNRHNVRIKGVTCLRGSNTSIRRSAIERVGGWDELTEAAGDEESFDFKFMKTKKRGEYFLYDPQPTMLRRLDISGGLDRRTAPLRRILKYELQFSHQLIRKYFPLRFYGLYPLYLFMAAKRSVLFVKDHNKAYSWPRLIRELVLYFLPELVMAWSELAKKKHVLPEQDGSVP